jgi:hypothetical protein
MLQYNIARNYCFWTISIVLYTKKNIKEHDVLETDPVSETLYSLVFFKIPDDGHKTPVIPSEISCFLYCEDSCCAVYIMIHCSLIVGYQHLRGAYCLKLLS